jgi:hypothetical protein
MSPHQAWNGLYGSVAWAPRTLAADDLSGVRALYGARAGADARGVIEGTLSWPGGAWAFGVNVWAEELKTGRVVSGTITLTKGSYRLEGLQSDTTYRIVASALSGPLQAADFVEAGAYAAILSADNSVHAEEIGYVTPNGGQTAYLSKQLQYPSQKAPQPLLFGLNGEFGNSALTLIAGQTYTLLLSGVNLENVKIRAASPLLYVSPASLQVLDGKAFGLKEQVVGWTLAVNPLTPAGDYTLRLQTPDGVAFLPGALTVEAAAFAGNPKAAQVNDLAVTKPETDNSLHSAAATLLESFDTRRDKER